MGPAYDEGTTVDRHSLELPEKLPVPLSLPRLHGLSNGRGEVNPTSRRPLSRTASLPSLAEQPAVRDTSFMGKPLSAPLNPLPANILPPHSDQSSERISSPRTRVGSGSLSLQVGLNLSTRASNPCLRSVGSPLGNVGFWNSSPVSASPTSFSRREGMPGYGSPWDMHDQKRPMMRSHSTETAVQSIASRDRKESMIEDNMHNGPLTRTIPTPDNATFKTNERPNFDSASGSCMRTRWSQPPILPPLNLCPESSSSAQSSPARSDRSQEEFSHSPARVSFSLPRAPTDHATASRRRRSGWWDGTGNKDMEMHQIRQMLRSVKGGQRAAESDAEAADVEDECESDTSHSIVLQERDKQRDEPVQTQNASTAEGPEHSQATSGRVLRNLKRNSSLNMKSLLSMDPSDVADQILDAGGKGLRHDFQETASSGDGLVPSKNDTSGAIMPSVIKSAASAPSPTPTTTRKERPESPSAPVSAPIVETNVRLSDEKGSPQASSAGRCLLTLPAQSLQAASDPNVQTSAIAIAAEAADEFTLPSIPLPVPPPTINSSEAVMQVTGTEADTVASRPMAEPLFDDIVHTIQVLSGESVFITPFPQHTAISSIVTYLVSIGLDDSAKAMRNEPGLAGKIAREACLRSFMESRDFVRAIQCVEELKLVVAASDNKLEPTTARHLTAFDDLIYVLSKYMCIHQTEIGALDMAQDTLDHVLYPRVELESAGKSKVRGDWFRKDLNLLRDLIAQKCHDRDSASVPEVTGDSSTPMGKTSTSNPYSKVNWTREFTAFWEAADMWITRQAQRKASGETSDVHEGPLFARALGEYFYAREHKDPLQPSTLTTAPLWDEHSLETFYAGWSKWERVRSTVQTHTAAGDVKAGIRRGKMRKERRKQRTYTPETPSVVRSISETERETKGAQWGRSQKQNAISPNVPGGVADSSKRNSAKLKRHSMSPIISTGQANSSPTFTVATKARPPTALGNGSPPRPRMTVSSGSESAKSNRRASVDPRDISSADPDRKSHVSHGSVYSFSGDADMPPINPHSFSADFALSSTCGPLLSQIRALDVVDIPETRQIVAATAGNFDRTDKKISIWDVRSGKLLIQLDNGTSKPVTSLVFHPDNPYLLVSSDMEFDVKLWDWRTGVCVRLWRKFHSRIIFKVGIVPGSEDRAATCSSDQSIKVFSLNSTSPATVSSMHANEPFNSFVFSGSADDPSQQKLIASLSYSIRIYRLRTSTLLHTIQLRDLRVNKTPITTLHSHPLHDTYVLLSCDNQLRLVNLITETTVKVYQSRNIPNGVRVEGRFSPCGTWVYCGTWDVRGRGKVRDEVEDSVAGGAGGSGVIVWKAHTGKEEKVDWGTNTPVSVCKWIAATDSTVTNKANVCRKALVTGGLDRIVRVYL